MLSAGGEAARAPLDAVERVTLDLARVQGQLARSITSAANVQSAIDGFEGLPTGAQMQQLNWAWEDALAAVNALNRIIEQEMPAVYGSMEGPPRWQEVKAVTPPTRPQ